MSKSVKHPMNLSNGDAEIDHRHDIEETHECEAKQLNGINMEGARHENRDNSTKAKYHHGMVCLAPMVRVSTLPFRLLALQHGAHLAYSEETIDHALVTCTRRLVKRHIGSRAEYVNGKRERENDVNGATDEDDSCNDNIENDGESNSSIVQFVSERDGRIVFDTCSKECGRNVLQLGTSDATRALKAAELVSNDVAAIDINMGCPKSFSLSGGMGAALLENPETVRDILQTLRRNISIPVTAKIRLHDDLRRTIEFVSMLKDCGVSAVAVHGRRVTQRSSEAARWEEIKTIVDAHQSLGNSFFPIIANGDVKVHADIKRIAEATGAAGVMIARGAYDVSVFSDYDYSKGATKRPLLYDLRRSFARMSLEYRNNVGKVKWTLSGMIKAEVGVGKKFKKEMECMSSSKTLQDIVKVYEEPLNSLLLGKCTGEFRTENVQSSKDSAFKKQRVGKKKKTYSGHRRFFDAKKKQKIVSS